MGVKFLVFFLSTFVFCSTDTTHEVEHLDKLSLVQKKIMNRPTIYMLFLLHH
jgi:hypothetical protein